MTPDYAAAAAEVHPAARMDAAIGVIAHRVGAPTTVGETLRLLTACARFADDPKAFGIADRLTASLTQRAFPLPHPEAMMAAVYGAGQAVAALDAAKHTVDRLETEPPSQTTAEILRGWAADADEAMQGPLLALAQHAEQELATAGQSVAADAAREAERSALEVIAERLSAIGTGDHAEAPIVIEPETFAILACLTRLEASVKYGVQMMREALEIKDTVGAQAHEWRAKAEQLERALFEARRASESLQAALAPVGAAS